MNNNGEISQNQQASQPAEVSKNNKKHDKVVVALVFTIIIFIFILSFLLYSFFQKSSQLNKTPASVPTIIPSPTVSQEEVLEKDIKSLETVSSSDEVGAIEKDIDASNFSTLDSDLNLLEKQL